jgi:hypothetical protein
MDKQDNMHARACLRPRARAHERVGELAYAQIRNMRFLSTQQRFRERSLVLRYVYIACPVFASYILSSCYLPVLGWNIFVLNVSRLFLFSSEF